MEQQRLEHERAGPAAVLLPPLIEHSRDKLDLLRQRLSTAEEAKRASDLDSTYLAQRELALHFEQAGDRWLSDHFHQRCLDTGKMVKGDNRRKEGEAHFHVALSYENRGTGGSYGLRVSVELLFFFVCREVGGCSTTHGHLSSASSFPSLAHRGWGQHALYWL